MGSRAAIKSEVARGLLLNLASWVSRLEPWAVKTVDKARFFLEMRPNRSLSPTRRFYCFLIIASTTTFFAGVATAVGAWMVLPFAGLEIFFLWLAFQIIGRHDRDYERVLVAGREFCWTRCECGRIEELSGNAEWAHVSSVARNGKLEIGLRYMGRTVLVGKMISDEQRISLCRSLVRVLK